MNKQLPWMVQLRLWGISLEAMSPSEREYVLYVERESWRVMRWVGLALLIGFGVAMWGVWG